VKKLRGGEIQVEGEFGARLGEFRMGCSHSLQGGRYKEKEMRSNSGKSTGLDMAKIQSAEGRIFYWGDSSRREDGRVGFAKVCFPGFSAMLRPQKKGPMKGASGKRRGGPHNFAFQKKNAYADFAA